jgi:hypothetical protein
MRRKEAGMRKRKEHKGTLHAYMRATGVTKWRRWGYRFNFGNGVYTRDGKPLYIRPAEELYLYERLTMNKTPKETTCRYAIQRLRERYGAEFLAEIFYRCPSRGVGIKARNGYFERVLQEYMEYEERGYRFNFLHGTYTWNGDELSVMPKEAVLLYERTVLGLRGNQGVCRHGGAETLYRMRKKFGDTFLRERLPGRKGKPSRQDELKSGILLREI